MQSAILGDRVLRYTLTQAKCAKQARGSGLNRAAFHPFHPLRSQGRARAGLPLKCRATVLKWVLLWRERILIIKAVSLLKKIAV